MFLDVLAFQKSKIIELLVVLEIILLDLWSVDKEGVNIYTIGSGIDDNIRFLLYYAKQLLQEIDKAYGSHHTNTQGIYLTNLYSLGIQHSAT